MVSPKLILVCIFLSLVSCGFKQDFQNYNSLATEGCSGFVRDEKGRALKWKTEFPLVFHFHSQIPKDFVNAIEQAMQTWNSAAGFELFKLSEIQIQAAEYNENQISEIVFLTDWPEELSSVQGQTLLNWKDAVIFEADVLINAKNQKLSLDPKENEADFESLVLHELGHVLGLAHSGDENSIMAKALVLGTQKREVSDEDRRSIQCRYPLRASNL